VEALRSSTEVQLLGDGDEVSKLAQLNRDIHHLGY
jgi:hypothetical protein